MQERPGTMPQDGIEDVRASSSFWISGSFQDLARRQDVSEKKKDLARTNWTTIWTANMQHPRIALFDFQPLGEMWERCEVVAG